MKELRSQFQQYLLQLLDKSMGNYADLAYSGLVIVWIAIFALCLHFILHRFVIRLVERLSKAKSINEHILSITLFKRIAYIIQGGVVQMQSRLWLSEDSILRHVLEVGTNLWMLLFLLLSVYALLDSLQGIIRQKSRRIHFPIRGVFQTIKLVASILFALVAISILLNKSPWILLSGLGALSAVIMLVFKDPILGLVAGIQLSANNMLAFGDWLEMPKYGADGEVLDIGLTTVKVQNWDKTITMIPTYALISDSFKNWRGMSQSGGRRIKRSLNIDISSIHFLSDEEIKYLKSVSLLTGYLDEKESDIGKYNSEKASDHPINHRRLTNIGTFRAYLVAYLKSHPRINQNMTLLVRQLEPSSTGVPIQIYTFTNTTAWGEYEDIQSDIFDHIFAVLNEFGLRQHEAPTGSDMKALSEKIGYKQS